MSYALAKLAEGETVLQIAEALGYASPSNFIAMFRKAFGDSRRVIFPHWRERGANQAGDEGGDAFVTVISLINHNVIGDIRAGDAVTLLTGA